MREAGEDPRDPGGGEADALHDHNGYGGNGDDDEEHLEEALTVFYEKLKANDSVIHLDNATWARWQHQYDLVMKSLTDSDEEADMAKINEVLSELLNAL